MVYNDDLAGTASYKNFIGGIVATMLGAAFFFDLFWPERKGSPSIHIPWKVCAVVACVLALSDISALTVSRDV